MGPSGCCGLLDISFILSLLLGAIRQALWLLKATFAICMFGFIISDTGASAETTAIRLAGLACVCFLLGISTTSAKPNRHLEDKIKMLERRLGEMEKNKWIDRDTLVRPEETHFFSLCCSSKSKDGIQHDIVTLQ